jgi:hypothetical protein
MRAHDPNTAFNAVFSIAIAAVVIGVLVGMFAYRAGVNAAHREAVSAGAATYHPGKDGNPEFQWIKGN